MTKLYAIQDEITSVNDTIKSSNTTIMNKLYLIQDDLANITLYLQNVTNITILSTANTTAEIDALYAKLRNFIVGYLSGGEPTNQTCIANDTLRVYHRYQMEIQDAACPTCTGVNSTKFVDLHCAYGCDSTSNPAQCIASSPFNFVIFLVMTGLGLYLMFGRKDPIINIIGALIFIVSGAFTLIYGIDLSLLFGMTNIMIQNVATLLMGLVFVGLGMYRIASAYARVKR